MIRLTRLDGVDFVINAELIETVEQTPDTIIKLSTGRKYLVKDSLEEIVNKVTEYKQIINLPSLRIIQEEVVDAEGV